MSQITREQLHAYLDDSLSDHETAQVEQKLRESEGLRRQLRTAMQERDRGEHSIGAVWRRQRLSCPTREELGNYLLQVLEDGPADYVDFHLRTIGSAFCLANVADLQAQQQEPVPKAEKRRKRFFDSSAGYLRVAKAGK